MRRIRILLIILFISFFTLISCKPSLQKISVISNTSSVILDNQKQQVTYISSYLNDNNNYVYVFKIVSINDDLLKDIIDVQEFSIKKDNKIIYSFSNNFANPSVVGENFIIYLDDEKIDTNYIFDIKKITKHKTHFLEIEIIINHLFEDNTLSVADFDDCSQEIYISIYNKSIIIES